MAARNAWQGAGSQKLLLRDCCEEQEEACRLRGVEKASREANGTEQGLLPIRMHQVNSQAAAHNPSREGKVDWTA